MADVTTVAHDASSFDDRATVEVRPLTTWTGAEILGVDASSPLAEATRRLVWSALLQWKVVFFRDQHLDHESHIAFARQFGRLTWSHPYDAPHPRAHDEIYELNKEATKRRYADGVQRFGRSRPPYLEGWHTDVTEAVNPPSCSILRAASVPPYGGNTSFTNTVAAYESLSPTLQEFVNTLWAEHRPGGTDSDSTVYQQHPMVAHHPVVRVHPETGERALYVNPSKTSRILGLSARESEWLLDHLYEAITRPAFQVSFRWTPGAIAIWDNRATCHRAPVDLGGYSAAVSPPLLAHEVERTMYRITLIGDIPVSVDGTPSTLIEGVPFEERPLFDLEAT